MNKLVCYLISNYLNNCGEIFTLNSNHLVILNLDVLQFYYIFDLIGAIGSNNLFI